MSDAIGLIKEAMRADADTLRVVGQNIANAEVTAYRRQISVARTGFDEVVDAQGAQSRRLSPIFVRCLRRTRTPE